MNDSHIHKRIAILGSTGSIGTQTLDVVRASEGDLTVSVLAAGHRVDALIEQAREVRPALAIIADESRYAELHEALSPLGIATAAGAQAIAEAMSRPDIDTVVTATVGYSGLAPTVAAIRAGKDIALANKETLVVAGDLIRRLLDDSPSHIYPVDSEHSAIAQCLAGESPETVRRLIITASGGPFRNWSAARIAGATAAQALKHPNWSMGAKITIDSASMMNKAFEIIEAHYLFDLPGRRIKAIVHPQSIVHSMVEFKDGAVKAQLGTPDMRLPIAYALACSTRPWDRVAPRLSLADMAALTFEEPDTERFPCLTLARYALDTGGNAACVINAANEVAVEAFLHDAIPFTAIYSTVTDTLGRIAHIDSPTLDDLRATNAEARAIAIQSIKRYDTIHSTKH